MSERIVSQIASELNIAQYIQVKHYGSAQNSFTVAASLELDGKEDYSNLIVLDGDVYTTQEEKADQIKSALSGTGDQVRELRSLSLRWFNQYIPVSPETDSLNDVNTLTINPERYLIDSAKHHLEHGGAASWVRNYLDYADRNVFSDESKSVIWNIHNHFGRPIDMIEQGFIDAASQTPGWTIFTRNVRDRLVEMARSQQIDIHLEAA